jgi:hypothetical protein
VSASRHETQARSARVALSERGYDALDITPFCNAGIDAFPAAVRVETGLRHLYGLPFAVGSQPHGERVILLSAAAGTAPVEMSIQSQARWIVFAHAVLESNVPTGGHVGGTAAEYVVRLADGSSVSAPIRERFEIGLTHWDWQSHISSTWGQLPFLAEPDKEPVLMPRDAGSWEDMGQRQVEVVVIPNVYDTEFSREYGGIGLFVWAWRNPRPELELDTLTLHPGANPVAIAAITLSTLDEEPLSRAPMRDVILELSDGGAAPFDLDVQVDRGLATYAYPLPESAHAFLADEAARGWGESRNRRRSPAYVRIAASPSAEVRVRGGDEELGTFTWDAVSEEPQELAPNLRVRVRDEGRNWVRTTVVDADSGIPIPCRLHFRSREGVPFQPHGHHNHLNSDLGTWAVDIGGDLRLGHSTYAYVDGSCEGWLPRGEVLVDVARGFEYEPLREAVPIGADQRELTLRLRRAYDMKAEGWYSGDTHVHFLSERGAHLEAGAEGLNVLNLLVAQWGHMFSSIEEFTGRPSSSHEDSVIVRVAQEARQVVLGHLIMLGLERLAMPLATGGPTEGELGGTLETTVSHWADACHAQGGTVVLPHFPNPSCEYPALIATGRADAVEFMLQDPYAHMEYYRYLNCGYRLPLVGGTDKMSGDVPVGLYRTYARIGPDEAFTFDSWCAAVRAGRTFMSGGPLLGLSVDGEPIGSTVRVGKPGAQVQVEARARSIFPIHTLEIVHDGEVVASTEDPSGARELELSVPLEVASDGWVAARCGGPGYFGTRHHDGWGRGMFAHTSPTYLALGAEYARVDIAALKHMRALVEGGFAYTRERCRHFAPGSALHHHGETDHLAFLQRPLREALAAIDERLRDASRD